MLGGKFELKIIYMGTPDFAVPSLERLYEKYGVSLVCTNPDKPVGRKQIMTMSDVKKKAVELNIPVYQPKTLKSDEAFEYLSGYEPDYIVVAAYGKILPKRILDLPKYGCVNIHGSLLPKYRGAAPIQRAVLAGEKKTGITIMLMNEGLDTGDILAQKEYEIGENETSGEVFEALANMAPDILTDTLEKYSEGSITPVKQDDSLSNYAKMLTKEEALIDFSWDDKKIHDFIRGMNPWPVAYTFFDGKKIKIFDSGLTGERTFTEPGTLYSGTTAGSKENKLLLSCGNSLSLEILSVQPEGKKRMDAKSFIAGYLKNH